MGAVKSFIENKINIGRMLMNTSLADMSAKEALLIISVAIYLLGVVIARFDAVVYTAVCAAAYKKIGLAVAGVVAYDIKKYGKGPKIKTVKVMPGKDLREYAYLIAILTFIGYMLLDFLPVKVVTWGYMYLITILSAKMAKDSFYGA